MSAWQTVYLDTVNETNARALAAQLGSNLQAGQFSAGDENYTFLAYTQWDRWPGANGQTDMGQVTAGFWVLARFNTDRPAGLSAHNAVLASGYVKTPTNPSNVWAS